MTEQEIKELEERIRIQNGKTQCECAQNPCICDKMDEFIDQLKEESNKSIRPGMGGYQKNS